MEAKTIRQWLEELPEPYRSEALENSDYGEEGFCVQSLAMAIRFGFSWKRSNEGPKYWEVVYEMAERNLFTKKN